MSGDKYDQREAGAAFFNLSEGQLLNSDREFHCKRYYVRQLYGLKVSGKMETLARYRKIYKYVNA